MAGDGNGDEPHKGDTTLCRPSPLLRLAEGADRRVEVKAGDEADGGNQRRRTDRPE
jgi:hypothetical protein